MIIYLYWIGFDIKIYPSAELPSGNFPLFSYLPSVSLFPPLPYPTLFTLVYSQSLVGALDKTLCLSPLLPSAVCPLLAVLRPVTSPLRSPLSPLPSPLSPLPSLLSPLPLSHSPTLPLSHSPTLPLSHSPPLPPPPAPLSPPTGPRIL